MAEWVDVETVENFQAGSYRVVDIDDVAIAIFNLDGRYYAIEDSCTHDGDILTGGSFQGEEITCPRHAARFCIKTGKALCAPAYEPVATFPVQVRDGIVQVMDDRWD